MFFLFIQDDDDDVVVESSSDEDEEPLNISGEGAEIRQLKAKKSQLEKNIKQQVSVGKKVIIIIIIIVICITL